MILAQMYIREQGIVQVVAENPFNIARGNYLFLKKGFFSRLATHSG
jgi:hypothetical protein